ncbi:MAG: hypothetical protein N2038_15130, partial [Geminicoccaceae bacterium]|nr:hypothetical protein [Geminicoccaceae bacterium]
MALGDVLSVETLAVPIAFERAEERGVAYDTTSFLKRTQPSGRWRAGGPISVSARLMPLFKKTEGALKILFRVDRLVFISVADEADKSWKDLDGQPFAFHARGSGTEAIGDIIARREDMT